MLFVMRGGRGGDVGRRGEAWKYHGGGEWKLCVFKCVCVFW